MIPRGCWLEIAFERCHRRPCVYAQGKLTNTLRPYDDEDTDDFNKTISMRRPETITTFSEQ